MTSAAAAVVSTAPLPRHVGLAMAHVSERLWKGAILGIVIGLVVIPMTLRIGYQFLKLCVIGSSTFHTTYNGDGAYDADSNKNNDDDDDDVWVVMAVVMTMGVHHVGTTQWYRLEAYLHSWSATTTPHSSSASSSSPPPLTNDVSSDRPHDDPPAPNENVIPPKDDTAVPKDDSHLPTDHHHGSNNDLDSTAVVVVPSSSSTPPPHHHHHYSVTHLVVAFFVTCTIVRYLRARVPTIPILRHQRRWRWLPNILWWCFPSVETTLLCAVCATIYAILLATRWVGPTSFVRLSIFPLVSNPWDHTVRNLLTELRDALIRHSYPIHGSSPSPPSQNNMRQSKHIIPSQQQQHGIVPDDDEEKMMMNAVGRRYERPTIYATIQHMILSLLAGLAVAYIGVLPYTTTHAAATNDMQQQRYTQSVHMATCILTVFGSLLTVLDGVSHEINPYLYTTCNKTVWFREVSAKIVNRVLYTTTIVPILSMIGAASMMPTWPIGMWSLFGFVSGYAPLVRNCAAMSVFLYTYEEMTRTSLFHPRPNVSEMIRQWSCDDTSSSVVSQLGIVLNTLLCDPILVEQIVNVSYSMNRVGAYSFEKEELLALEKHSKQMAQVLLSPIYNHATQAPLEEDVFRIVLLEAFGGGGGSSSSDRRQLFTTSERHQRLISEWIDRPIPRQQSSKIMVKPLSSALVRGFCVFIGGTGTALTMLSSHKSLSPSPRRCQCSLAVFCSVELCVVAIGRCITRSLTSSSGQILRDWKCSHLSIQIPTALVAIYKLRCGVVQYSKMVNPNDTKLRFNVSGSSFIGAHLVKEYGQVVRTCDSVASLILQSMKSLQGGRIDQTLLDRDCQEWINDLTDQFTGDDTRKLD